MESLVSDVIPAERILPAVGQGALAVEVRSDDEFVRNLVGQLDDHGSRAEVQAERAFLKGLDGGCQIPIGALARCDGNGLTVRGIVSDLEGQRTIRVSAAGGLAEAEELGTKMAAEARRLGAEELLKEIRGMEGC
jgi:hydroxymethylbilane synthase